MRAVFKHYRRPKPIMDYWPSVCGYVDIAEELQEAKRIKGPQGVVVHYQKGVSHWMPEERGGYTECFLYDENGKLLAKGEAVCWLIDQFCYEAGRAHSMRKALLAWMESDQVFHHVRDYPEVT